MSLKLFRMLLASQARRAVTNLSALHWADILVAYSLFVMPNYLTGVWKLSITHAAGIVNICGGISKVLPVFFLFLVDALLGNIMMLVISSIAYSVGIGFVTISTPPVFAIFTAGACKKYEPECIDHTQELLFYVGMALIAVGVAGNLASIKPLPKEQGYQYQPDSNWTTDCSKLPGLIVVAVVPLVGAIALPYVKPWKLRFGIPAICTLVATLLFLSGSCCYKRVELTGSPLCKVCRVFVAEARKRSQRPVPNDSQHFHKENPEDSFSDTSCLGCLHKAAIILEEEGSIEDQKKRWKLSWVAEVESAKIAIRMVPMWTRTTFVICGIVSSIGNTYFVEQAKTMNRDLGTWKVPIQLFLLAQRYAKTGFAKRSDCLVRMIPLKTAPSSGIALAMIFSILCCITAAVVEAFRLEVIRSHGSLDKPEVSVFWLLFQFILLAGLDLFFDKSVAEFYKDQSPPGMENYLEHFAKGVSGLGFMFSVLPVYVVRKISEELGSKTNWFQHRLDESRLDR